MTSDNTVNYSLDQLNAMDDDALCQVDWKSLRCFNGRLLELHAEGRLGNEFLAKLPRRPILCIDQIDRIDDEIIEATFTFPEKPELWAFQQGESLEMLFQDQLDQLVGFWGCRKADGIGRALSSGSCQLLQSLDYAPGATFHYVLNKRKWMENKAAGSGGTAVFNGKILSASGELVLDTKNVIVGILNPADIQALRDEHGGRSGVAEPASREQDLVIPVYDPSTIDIVKSAEGLERVHATQTITPELWPLRYHFRGDPVVPGNFGTHGMIALVKAMAVSDFNVSTPVFTSMVAKKFSGMIFEDSKQIRFELLDVRKAENNSVVAAEANLYLETSAGERMIEDPIYTFKKITVISGSST